MSDTTIYNEGTEDTSKREAVRQQAITDDKLLPPGWQREVDLLET